MKKSFFYVTLILMGFSISQQLKSQECDFYFPNEKGTIIETTSYDKKGKATGVGKTTILENKNTETGQIIKVEAEYEAKGADSTFKQEYSMECKNGEFYVNMDAYINKASMSAYQKMEIEVDIEQMTIPANLKPGQVLNDGKLTIRVKNNGIKMLTINTLITDRKVDGFEKITTSAGTFDCVKLSYTIETKMMFKVRMSGKEWIAKNIGIVKSEAYNKKGKLESTTLLTKITK